MGLVEFAAGWALGAKAGESHFDEVVETAKTVIHSPEVADLLHALRSHVGYSLKELGGLVMGDEAEPAGDDLRPAPRRDGRRRIDPAAPGRAGRAARQTRRGVSGAQPAG